MKKLVPIKEYIVSQKVIAHVPEEYAKLYHLPEGHRSIGIFTATNDDPCFMALDDATKKVEIKALRVAPHFGGGHSTLSKVSGCVYGTFSAPSVDKVKTALSYIKEFVETRSEGFFFEGDVSSRFYAQCIPKMGKYYSEQLHVPEGTPYAYMIGSPVEAVYALDKSLKSGDVKLVRYIYPPGKVNSGGGIIIGSEAACRAAKEAFIEGLYVASQHKVRI